MKKWVASAVHRLGYEIVHLNKVRKLPTDFDPLHTEVYEKVKDNTMTSPERIYSLIEAVQYLGKNDISGAIVECGVWKGGSMMAIAQTLNARGDQSRELFLYDTFEGMPAPGEKDRNWSGESAINLLNKDTDKEKSHIWAYSTIETVRQAMRGTRYPENKIHYVQGKVEETIPGTMPGEIALLRLDTDWYESTRHELHHLFPLLKKGGVLILDDYGHWQGARTAVDEYFNEHPQPILLNRIDETGRIAIKQMG